MASLDLGTLVARVKAEGVDQAKTAFKGVSDAVKGAGVNAAGTTTGIKSLKDAFVGSIGQTKLLGGSLGSLTGALGSSEAMAGMLGGMMAGLVTAGIMLAVQAIKAMVAAIADFVKESFKLGVTFQATMSKVQAITGSTGNDMAKLTEGAKKFGAETVFSASEAAEAMTFMGMAGWKTEQIMAGMPGVLNLAASSGESLARTSDIVTDTLTALGESAAEAGRLSDVMAAAATNSNTNVSMMGETFKYAAPVAGALGYAMEDLAVATGLMANAGIKGETAGTTLRSLLTNMVKPTKKMQGVMDEYKLSITDTNGVVKPLNAVIDELREKMQGVDAATKAAAIATIAGKEAMSGTLAIINASDEDYKKLTSAINGSSGASAKMAATMTDNIAGLQKSINSKMESIKLSLFGVFEPFIQGFLKIYNEFIGVSEKLYSAVGGILGKITGFITPFVDTFVVIFKSLVDLVWPLLEPFFAMIETNLGNVMRGLQMAAAIVGGVVNSIKDALMPLVEFINNVLMAAVDLMSGNFQGAADRMVGIGGQLADALSAIFLFIPNLIINVINSVTTKLNEFFNLSIKQLAKYETNFAEQAKSMGDNAEKAKDVMVQAEKDMQTELEGLEKLYSSYKDRQLKTYEDKVRAKYQTDSIANEKAIQKELEGYERMLNRKIEMDRKVEQNRAQGNFNKVTASYANGTINSRGEYALVGEFRPEIIRLNKGDSVQQINNTNTGMNTGALEKIMAAVVSEIQSIKTAVRNLPIEQKNNAYMGRA